MPLLIFEDEHVSRLYPVTVGRPAYAISVGSYRLIDRLLAWNEELTTVVRPHLRAVEQADYALAARGGAGDGLVLAVNARLVPSAEAIKQLRAIYEARNIGVVRTGDAIAAALLPQDMRPPAEEVDAAMLVRHLGDLRLPSLVTPGQDYELPLLDYPHDIIRYHMRTLRGNLDERLHLGTYQEIADGVFAAPGATLGQYAVTDTKAGPILLEENARIGPHCYLSGPAHLGPKARIIEHSAIKDGVALGHTTKIGGEIEASIIEPYTNKQHYGFLGHSYLGSWINMGAGTCNSDLKNTYGQVNMEYNGRKVPTGMQFVGVIVGDYAKTAINTGIFTGKTIGVCSMVYGFVTTNVPSFVNYARLFGQVTETPVDVMVATQARMFERRNVTQRPCDVQLLHAMYELTRHERQLAGEPLSL
ncbi:MAG: putative sugar nucleotidyl transferase [Planctomycetia bacterium]|nr:putative sugar nucleotidyl transferase [Planctomycetia bacterium]